MDFLNGSHPFLEFFLSTRIPQDFEKSRPNPKKYPLKMLLKLLSELGRAREWNRQWLCGYLDYYQDITLENEKAGRLFVRANLQRPAMHFSPYSVIVRVRIYFSLAYIRVSAL